MVEKHAYPEAVQACIDAAVRNGKILLKVSDNEYEDIDGILTGKKYAVYLTSPWGFLSMRLFEYNIDGRLVNANSAVIPNDVMKLHHEYMEAVQYED